MDIRLNLATRPLENTRRFISLAATAGIILVGLFIFLSVTAFNTWRENRAMREETNRLQGEMSGFRDQRRDLEQFFKQDETKRVLDRAAFLNGLIEQRSFPWTRIFMDLERLLPTGARIVSLAPKREEGRIELSMTIGAQNDEAKVRLLKALEDSAEFERVVVSSESRKEGAADGDPITLELAARYRAADRPGDASRAAAQKGGQ